MTRTSIEVASTPTNHHQKRKSWFRTKASEVENKVTPFQGWPNDIGFEYEGETREPVELDVSGKIPDYVRGVLYRTGPGREKVETCNGTIKMEHWFDGFAVNHRFEILPDNKVTYRSRGACDALLEYMKETGKWDSYSFAQKRDPCESFFRKIMSSFTATPQEAAQGQVGVDDPSFTNVCVTLSPNMPGSQKFPGVEVKNSSESGHGGIATLTAKTDASGLQSLDPETLEPIGKARQFVLHPDLTGQFAAAHARTCPETGEFFNYNLKIGGPKATYRIFKISPEGETSIIAMITNASAAYLHSFFLTRKYVVLCVWSAPYAMGGAKIPYHRNILDSIAPFNPAHKPKFFVIDRSGERGVIATFESAAFFAFHTVNAFEENDDIILEVPIFSNLDILHSLYYKYLKSTSPHAGEFADRTKTKLTRWRLPNVERAPSPTASAANAVRQVELVYQDDVSIELPSINPLYLTRSHRYVYGIALRGKSVWVDGLVKHDTKTHTSIWWEVHGHSPSEPIFVANPDGESEDDGVLLTVVLDGFREKSYLLVLDAKDLTEVARAEMDTPVQFGFHGTYCKDGKTDLLSY